MNKGGGNRGRVMVVFLVVKNYTHIVNELDEK